MADSGRFCNHERCHGVATLRIFRSDRPHGWDDDPSFEVLSCEWDIQSVLAQYRSWAPNHCFRVERI